jgi:aarF domain-containing kinase
VYVPKVFREYSTKRVMTAEWIEGVRMSDRPGVRKLMGVDGSAATTIQTPTGPRDIGPLKGGLKAVSQAMIDTFCAQIFEWGFVCSFRPRTTAPCTHASCRCIATLTRGT